MTTGEKYPDNFRRAFEKVPGNSLREITMTETYPCPFGLTGIKIPPYQDLPSPTKSDNIDISVCASTWNRPKQVIIDSIISIFTQTFPPRNYELILIDDATEGERAKDVREAAEELIKDFPDHNFRAYFTAYTRCYTDPHTLNLAFKRARGWIIMTSQVDIIHIGETLEAAWRHHNMRENLGLCPKHYAGNLSNPWPFCYFPHEMGASIRKQWVDQIKGRNEHIIAAAPDVEFHFQLAKKGVVYGEDPTVKTIHVADHPTPRTGAPPTPNLGIDSRNSDGTWTTGDWGSLTSDEESKTMMSEAMKNVLSGHN